MIDDAPQPGDRAGLDLVDGLDPKLHERGYGA